jgi:hypothetical protein
MLSLICRFGPGIIPYYLSAILPQRTHMRSSGVITEWIKLSNDSGAGATCRGDYGERIMKIDL